MGGAAGIGGRVAHHLQLPGILEGAAPPQYPVIIFRVKWFAHVGKTGVREQQLLILPIQRALRQPGSVRRQPQPVPLILLQRGPATPTQPRAVGAKHTYVPGHRPVVVTL